MTVHYEGDATGRLTEIAGRYSQYAGAAVSLSLMIGVAIWGGRTIMRDVSGVPVVRAMQGEMRVAPAEPGGDVATHRGLAVNTVAAVGVAGAPEDTLTLAPRTLDLAEEDLDTAPLTDTATGGTDDATDPQITEVATADTPPTGPMSADDILAMADQIAAGATPMQALEGLEAAAPAAVATPAAATAAPLIDEASSTAGLTVDPDAAGITDTAAVEIDPIAAALAEAMGTPAPEAAPVVVASGVRSVIRPVIRPVNRPAQAAAAVSPAVATAADLAPEPVTVAAVSTAEVPPLPAAAVLTDDLPVGTKLVQLGAFPTPEAASAEWQKLQGRFGDVMGGKDEVIQQASSGGATFYRLRASGFAELADARAFCDTLDAGRVACIPVVVR
ncbi:Sporulation related domain-containing protein [Loktanella fryxellensis]|uniref:Sporulation related domain-containing protein n=1 Tax=Loktanella fryxellensis TaxID=245187 RepID=A0A1H7YAB5_9RHOB|nr:SPOR domain-containing protein [Loktanella fryxellensis]SEM42784.1 Sporulation related domain-containing protein [Loktanella fryxellensis]